jgi:hypothetical protein
MVAKTGALFFDRATDTQSKGDPEVCNPDRQTRQVGSREIGYRGGYKGTMNRKRRITFRQLSEAMYDLCHYRSVKGKRALGERGNVSIAEDSGF